MFGRFNDFAAAAHAAHVVDRLAENGKLPRHDVMRRILQPLRFAYE